MSYKKLEIWQISKELVIDIHKMSLKELPKFELDHLETLFETGSLKNTDLYNDFHNRLEILGKKINLFLQVIERSIKNK